MRGLLKWALLTLGIAALVRKLRSRGGAREAALDAGTTEATPADDPADELRRKLAETRGPPDTPEADEGSASEGSVEGRRADVHEQGRAAVDEMRPQAGDE